MTTQTVAVLIAFLVLSGPGARAEDAYSTAPQVQLTKLTGEVRVEAPNRSEAAPGQSLPNIRSGSLVRVLSGEAEFETGYHAIIKANKGDAFRVTAEASEGTKPGEVRVALAEEGSGRAFSIRVGDKRFRLHKGGSVVVEGTAPGETTVRSETGDVQNPLVEFGDADVSLALTRPMTERQSLAVGVPSVMEFEIAPASLSALTIAPVDRTTFEIRAAASDAAARSSKEETADKDLSGWPSVSQRAARATIEKYGQPDLATSEKLVWNNNGAWRQTIVYRLEASRAPGTGREDVISQSVNCEVPRDKAADVARMDIGVRVDADGKGLTATSDSEETNFLAVNLAHDVIKGLQTPSSARDFYDKTVELSAAGKSSSYTQGLLFQREP